MHHALRILFYDDAADFGGHELMTLAAVRHAAMQPGAQVAFMFFDGNARLAQHIADFAAQCPGFTPLPQAYASAARQVVRTLYSGRAIRTIAAAMAAYAPDVLVVAQGGIAVGSAGLMAGKKLGVPTLSYIPMTHPESLFSASAFKAWVRDGLNRVYYRLPDEYITISAQMQGYLVRRGLRQPVAVVPNGIDLNGLRSVDRLTARAALGLTEQDKVVAVIGRVQFWQKRHDLAITALRLARQERPDLKLLVVGDGPDLVALKQLAIDENVAGSVVFAAWSGDPSSVYAAINALVIPSRYEGVPLVMLEAMYLRKPVIAAAVDGMADTLPPHWLFPSGDAAALAARLVEVAGNDEPALLEAHHQQVLSTFSMPAFERAFMAAIVSAVERSRSVRVAMIEPVGGHGGMNYYDFGLCQGLVGANVTPTLYTCDETRASPGLPFEVKRVYQRIFGADPAWRRGLRYLAGSLRALVGARRGGNRLAHFHVFQVGVLELFNVLLARLLLLRVVITAHDVESFRGEWSGIKSMVYGAADAVIAHNRVSQRELVRVLGIPERKIHVIPHGNYLGHVGAMPSAESARATLGLPRSATVLLFFGQIKEVKGLDLLLEAAASIKADVPELRVLIAGKMWGQDFAHYQAQIDRLGLREHCVAHVRYIADDEVAAYYAAADLVVLPYRRIYQSGVILMAMSYGKPVLAADLHGMTEVIEDGATGYAFRTGDSAHLAQRLRTVLADPAGMQRVAANGLELMRTRYSWEHIGQLTGACYRAVLAKGT